MLAECWMNAGLNVESWADIFESFINFVGLKSPYAMVLSTSSGAYISQLHRDAIF